MFMKLGKLGVMVQTFLFSHSRAEVVYDCR